MLGGYSWTLLNPTMLQSPPNGVQEECLARCESISVRDLCIQINQTSEFLETYARIGPAALCRRDHGANCLLSWVLEKINVR